jgi:hypothetical protein
MFIHDLEMCLKLGTSCESCNSVKRFSLVFHEEPLVFVVQIDFLLKGHMDIPLEIEVRLL